MAKMQVMTEQKKGAGKMPAIRASTLTALDMI